VRLMFRGTLWQASIFSGGCISAPALDAPYAQKDRYDLTLALVAAPQVSSTGDFTQVSRARQMSEMAMLRQSSIRLVYCSVHFAFVLACVSIRSYCALSWAYSDSSFSY
jgi:hypothetical protein